MSKPLEYLRLSPVRGQLEPYDPKSPMGWRYIQTTDTLNELKVCPSHLLMAPQSGDRDNIGPDSSWDSCHV